MPHELSEPMSRADKSAHLRTEYDEVHMNNIDTVRWFAMLSVTAVFALGLTLESQSQSGGGAGSGSGTGGAAAGGSMGSRGSTGSDGPGTSRGKNFDDTLKTPDKPGMSPQQRDRAQRLEERLRQGEVSATTPQTQMSDRLEQLHKNSPPGQSSPSDTGQ